MGLDMYLQAEYFFWTDDLKGERAMKVKEAFPEMEDMRLEEVTFEVGYWRKANPIHKWFVDNVQDGEDDCGRYHVTVDELKELRNICEEVLKKAKIDEEKGIITNTEEIEELLPTKEGFFFGGTDYDKCYLHDVKNTIKIIDRCLELPEKYWDFIYHSSW